MEITIVVHREPTGYWSEVTELPGCFAAGGTLSELAEAIEEAVGMCLDREVRLEHEPLRPGAVRAAVTFSGAGSP